MPEQAVEYKSAAIPMTYNLAANTWIGWGPSEAAAVRERHRELGLVAARKNVELAAELGLGPERRRNGYWILGAHQVAIGDHRAAAESFATSAALAKEAEDAAAALMAQGWCMWRASSPARTRRANSMPCGTTARAWRGRTVLRRSVRGALEVFTSAASGD